MGMTEEGNRKNRRQAPPDESDWFECEWDDCLNMVHDIEEGFPFCWMHYRQQLEEEQADTYRKMRKEDEYD